MSEPWDLPVFSMLDGVESWSVILRFRLNNLLLLMKIGSRMCGLAAGRNKNSTDFELGVVHLVTKENERI